MGKITHTQYEKLVAQDRAPINLPYEIYFNGNEVLQKTPGLHHLDQYRETGTYNHPNVREQRRRTCLDCAKRLLNGKMSAVSLKKMGGKAGLKKRLEEFGLELDESQAQIIDMNADMLMNEYVMKKENLAGQRAQAGRKEITPPPTPEKTPEQLAKEAGAAQASQVPAKDDLSSISENDKEKFVQSLDFKQLQKQLKLKGIKQTFGQTKEEKQELLLKNLV